MPNGTLQVSVGVVFDAHQQILITQRPQNVAHGGYWEFPGGKIELGETPYQALCREIQEEVGLTIQSAQLVHQVGHHYPDKPVNLFIFHITEYQGTASCLTKQLDLRWVNKQNLAHYTFPEANLAIINHLIR